MNKQKQRGYLEGLDGLLAIMAVLSVFGILGVVAGIYFGIPALWDWVRPMLHAATG